MNQAFAIFLIIVAAIYLDTDSNNPVLAFILPAILTLSLAYLFWFQGFLAIGAIALGVYNTDLESVMLGEGVLWPIFTLIAFLYLVFWITQKATQERSASRQGTGGSADGSSGGFWGDSDGGGDGGCGGGD